MRCRTGATLEGDVVACPGFRIDQRLICLLDGDEPLVCIRVLVDIRVLLFGEPRTPPGSVRRCVPGDAEDLVAGLHNCPHAVSSYETSPVSPFTVTLVPGGRRENSDGRRSIMGIPAMIAPTAMIGSASVLMIAAGARPFCFSA